MAISKLLLFMVGLLDKYGKYIVAFLATSSITILGYYLWRGYTGLDPFYPVGTNMVDKEITLIPDLIYMKPITIFVIISYTGYVIGLTTLTKYASENWGEEIYNFIDVLALVAAFISGYEVLFNFTLWSALISSITINGQPQGNIDTLYNMFPNPETPWNIVFATKVFTLIFAMALTTLFFTNRWRAIQRSRQKRQRS